MKLILAAALVCSVALAKADLGIYEATLSGGSEVPPVITNGSGTGSFTFDDVSGALGGSLSVADLGSTIVGAHIHVGALGVEGGILVDLGAPQMFGNTAVWDIAFTLNGDIGPDTLTNAEFKSLLDSGGAYFNVHTETYPDGEIRGQIAAVPEPATIAALGIGALALMRRRRAR